MTQDPHKITELDLLAYADGFLESDPERLAIVERYLQEHPDAAAYVAEIQAQNDEIRSSYAPSLSEPVPERLSGVLFSDRRGNFGRRLAKAASILVLLAASATGGWLAGDQGSEQEAALKEFIEQAAASHENTVPEAAPTGAETQGPTQPLAWLTERISLELRAPNLSASGFELVGKKQLGPDRDPTVQLIYSQADGTKMNLFLRPRWEESVGKLQKEKVGERTVLYWLEGPLAVAMTLDAPGSTADTLAQTVQQSLDRARLNEIAPATALSPAPSTPAMEEVLGNGLQGPSRPATPSIEQGEAGSRFN